MKPFAIATVLLAGVSGVQGQITITSLDMFNAPGQYYRSYAADYAAVVFCLKMTPTAFRLLLTISLPREPSERRLRPS